MAQTFTRVSQQAAGYKLMGGVERCGRCRFFLKNNLCARVLGDVSPSAWCRLFSMEARAAMDAGGGAAATHSNAPPGITLSLDFTAGALDPSTTFTRASIGTYFDVAGTLQTATANTPRFDCDPVTHAARGLLMEEARTNLLLNSATLGTQSVTVTAVATTLSFYGTGTVTLSGVSTAGPLVGTGAFPQRVTLTFTPTAGTLTLTVTGSVLNAQLEAGAFATSWIPTTAAAVARATERASMPTGAWYSNPAAFTHVTDLMVPFANCGGTYMQMDDGTTNNRSLVQSDSGQTNTRTFENNAGVVTFNTTAGGPLLVGVVNKCGIVSASGQHYYGINGVAAANTGNVVAPPALTTMRFGSPVSATYGSMWISRVRFWPRALSSSELQQVTT